ncbi:hypothetical protein JXC34_02880 [Candidatus Woesearchaeota archaeon]|nr:hypothetical protein [Candidatus Woesearchaeota archaeon]
MINTNHRHIAETLKQKGWEDSHISKTIAILKKAEENKHPNLVLLDQSLFVVSLVLVVIMNILIFTGILPLIIELPLWLVILCVSLLGLCFGFFMDHALRHMDLYKHHYVLAGLILSVSSAAIMFLVLQIAQGVLNQSGIYIKTNPILLIMAYVISFSLPHFTYKIKETSKV